LFFSKETESGGPTLPTWTFIGSGHVLNACLRKHRFQVDMSFYVTKWNIGKMVYLSLPVMQVSHNACDNQVNQVRVIISWLHWLCLVLHIWVWS